MNNMKENLIAIIKNNIVENVIVASDEFANSLNEETVNVTDLGVTIGWGYQNGNFIHPDDLLSPDELLAKRTQIEKKWRDSELSASDFIVPLTDHPKHAAYLVYRQELRDYPQQADFPNGQRPVKL
jgi:hypothetical protein